MASTSVSLSNALKQSWGAPVLWAKDLEIKGALADERRAIQRQFVVPFRPRNARSNKTRRTGLSYRQRQARGRLARTS